MVNDNVNKLYDALKANGYSDIGSLDDFSKKISDADDRKKLYDALVRDNFSDVGDYSSFNSKLGFDTDKTDNKLSQPNSQIKSVVDQRGDTSYVHPNGSVSSEFPEMEISRQEDELLKSRLKEKEKNTPVTYIDKNGKFIDIPKAKENEYVKNNPYSRLATEEEITEDENRRLNDAMAKSTHDVKVDMPDYSSQIKAPEINPFERKSFGDVTNDAFQQYASNPDNIDRALIDGKIEELKSKISDAERNGKKKKVSTYTQGSSMFGGGSWSTTEVPENQEDIQNAKNQLYELEKLQKAYKDKDTNVINQFAGELGRRSFETVMNTAALGIPELSMKYQLNKALENPDNELTREAYDLLNQYQRLHSEERTIAQDIAQGTLNSASFVAQFASTGGIAKGMLKGTEVIIAKKLGGSIAAKAIGKMGETAGRAFIQTALSPSTLTAAYQNNIENPGSFLDAYSNAFTQMWIENFTEHIGEFMPMKWNSKVINKLSRYTGVQGFVPEMAEEEIATILHSAVGDGQGQWSDLIDPRKQLVTAGTVLASQFPYFAISSGGYGAGKFRNIQQKRSITKGYQNNLSNMRTVFGWGGETNNYINQINTFIESSSNTENQINTFIEPGSDTERFNNFLRNNASNNEFNASNGDTERIVNFIYNIANDDEFNDKQKDAITKYTLSYWAYFGMNQAKADVVAQAAQRATEIIQDNVNPDMGGIVRADIAGNDRQIVRGNIIRNEDGTINREQSDQQIYYVDEDGNTQVAPIANVEITDFIPQNDAIEQGVDIATTPLINQQANDEVRQYEVGELVRFNMPQVPDALSGRILGMDENGNYNVIPDGFNQPVIIEPRQIINEDNLIGIDNGSVVKYSDENGIEKQGTVQDAYSLRSQGLIDIDGNMVPVGNVIGLSESTNSTQNESSPTEESNQTTENNPNAPTEEKAQQIQSVMGAMAGGVRDNALNAAAERIDKSGEFTLQKPESIEQARKESNYNIRENPDGTVTVLGVQTPDGVWHGAAKENTNSGQQATASYLEQIPKDEKGDLLFEQATPETTLSALSEIYDNPEELRNVVDAAISNNQKKLEKLSTPKPTGDIQKDIAAKQKSKAEAAEIQGKLDYWNNVLASMKPTKESVTKQLTGENVIQPEQPEQINPEELISQMEANAVPMPQLELTPENWYAEFGKEGIVQTPVGDVTMGENQLAKLILNKRTDQFGMIKPTLTNPDVIIEEQSREGAVINGRETNLLFVKTFTDNEGKKYKHFENVTVSKDKKEVVVSSHIIRPKQLLDKLKAGHVVYTATALDASGQTSAEYTPQTESGAPISDNKGMENKPDLQESGGENNIPESQSQTEIPGKSVPERLSDVGGDVLAFAENEAKNAEKAAKKNSVQTKEENNEVGKKIEALNAENESVGRELQKILNEYTINKKGNPTGDPEVIALRQRKEDIEHELLEIKYGTHTKEYLESILPEKKPDRSELIMYDEDNPLFKEYNGIVNARPIKAKSIPKDYKKAMFEIADGKNDSPPAFKGIYHDAKNGNDVVTNSYVLAVIPTDKNIKTWLEDRNGDAIDVMFPNYQSIIPEGKPIASITLTSQELDSVMDKITGAMQVQKFTDPMVVVGVYMNGKEVFFKPETMLKALRIMKATGSKSLSFEVYDKEYSPMVIRDSNNKNKLALSMPYKTNPENIKVPIPELSERNDSGQQEAEHKADKPRFQITPSKNNALADQSKYDFDVEGITDANAQEMQHIKTGAQADGTFMKAPNGNPTNLNERQWLQVRTKSFLDWFGDWIKAARIEKLRNSKSISITGNEITPSENIKEYAKNALQYGLDNLRGEYTNKDTGEKISVSRSSIEEVLHHNITEDGHIQAVAAIPQIIENGIYIDTEENTDKEKNPDVKDYDYYVVGLKIGGEDYTVKAVVANGTNGERYYDHRLTQIEKTKLLSTLPNVNKSGEESSNDFGYKDKRLISILQTNSSKIVDENGEPMVVYHGTKSEFTKFDHEKAMANAFYFTPIKRISYKYGKIEGREVPNVMELFLNIKNPLRLENAISVSNTERFSGHDGIFSEKTGIYNAPMYIAFTPNQIKSTTDNNGNFDTKSDDIRFQLIGEKGAAALDKLEEANTRINNLSVAKEMESSGKDARAIKFATGWEKGADGEWRYEIPDIALKNTVYDEAKRMGRENLNRMVFKLGEIVDADDLFKAYPQLRDMHVYVNKRNPNLTEGGSYSNGLIQINGFGPELESVLAHEIQHAVQNIEGFARGSNIKEAERQVQAKSPLTKYQKAFISDVEEYNKHKGTYRPDFTLSKFMQTMSRNGTYGEGLGKDIISMNDAELEEMYHELKQKDKFVLTPQEQYFGTAGEVEARNVQKRMNMTPEERRASLAAETEDVARKDQIFIKSAFDEAQAYLENQANIDSELEAVNTKFNEELDNFKAGTHKGLLHLGSPREILRAAGINAKELTLSPTVLNRKLKQHNLTTDDLKGLAKAIQKPFFVYQHGTKAPNIIVVTNAEVRGQKLSVAVELDSEGNVVEINNISSVHGKEAELELERLSTAESLKFKWVSNKENVLDWLGIARLEASSHTTNPKHLALAKVIENFKNPKLPGEKLQQSDNAFTPITKKEFDAVIDILKQKGLAKEVITDPVQMREALEKILGEEEASDFLRMMVSGNPRSSITKTRGSWTKDKIIKELKKQKKRGTNGSEYSIIRFISQFDNPQELRDHLFYHGTGSYVEGGLYPSITMSEREAEQRGGGGYGDRYYAISVSSSKKTASNFSGGSRSVTVYPVLLNKNAKVIDMPEIQDSAELEDIIEELWNNDVDAVRIGDHNAEFGTEKELAVINPNAISVLHSASETHRVFGGIKLEEITDAELQNTIDNAKKIIVETDNFKEKNKDKTRYLHFSEDDLPVEEKEKIKDEYRKYKDELSAFIQDLKAGNTIRLMATSNGEVYGFATKDGTIYLDETKMNANTPIHEFGHLLNDFLEQNNPELWKKGVELAKQSAEWKRVKSDPNYSDLKDDNAIANEVLSSLYGNRGEEIFKEKGIGEKLREWVNKVWGWIKSKLGIRNPGIRDLTPEQIQNLTLKQFVDMSIGELLNGKRIVPEKPAYKGGDVLEFAKQVKDWNEKNLEGNEKSNNFVENENNEISDGSTQEKLGSGNEVHSREQEVSIHIAASIKAAAEKLQRQLQRHELSDIEKRAAFDYAKSNGLWIDDLYSLGAPFPGGGNENTLAYDEKTGTIYKSNNLLNSHDRISDLLESIKIHNELFPETKYELVGFTGIDNGENRTPYVEAVLKQNYVSDATNATPQEISNYMQSLGFKQINDHTFTNGRYTVSDLRPRNVLKDANGTVYVVDDIISKNPTESKVDESGARFQIAPSNPNIEGYRRKLDEKIDNTVFRLREAYEDKYLAVREFLDALRKSGVDVKDYNDFYLQATFLQGKNDAQLEQYNEHFQKPLNSAVNDLMKSGFTYRDVENYAILKHGLERNKYMSDQDIAEGKKPKGDYAGVLTVEDEVGMPAQQFIDEFEKKAGSSKIDDFWKKVNAATDFSLQKQLEGGVIGKDIFDELKNRYKYYIPLRGHDKETAEERWDYSPNTGTYFSNPLIAANGRISRAETPIAFIAQMAQSAIDSANKNTLNQTMLRLAREDHTGLLTTNKTWYVNGIPQEAAYSENADDYRQNIESFEKQMLAMESRGLAERKRKRLDIGDMFIKPSQAEQHTIHVRQNGQDYTVYINGNPAVSRAINGLNVARQSDFNKIAKLTRGMGQVFTSKNPLFWMTNFARDYHFATSMLLVKEDVKYMSAFQKNLPASASALIRHLSGKGDLSKKEDRYLAEYITNGGKTGFSHLTELNRIQKEVERDIKKGNKKSMLNHLVGAVENANDLIENMTRFSVYITSRDSGRNVIRSVSDAKEITVNFNRTGSGAMGANIIRPLYLFANAGIQGMSNFSRTFKAHPGKMTALLLFNAFTGAILFPLLAHLMKKDDEYWKLSDWDRQNNFCIPAGNGFVKIPVSQELRVFHGFGDNMIQAALGKKDAGTAFLDALGNFTDLIPTDPFGSASATLSEYKNKDAGAAAKTFIATLSPDFIKPVTQLAANRNFMGGQIYKENQKSYRPGYLKVRTNKKGEAYAPMWLVDFARETDNLTGGDGVEAGMISIQPDILQHFVRGYAGGVYDIFSNGVETAYKASKGENIEIKDTPIRRFYISTDDTEKMNQGMNSKYYNITKKVESDLSKVNDYKKEVGKGNLSVLEFNNKLKELDYENSMMINSKIKTIKKLEDYLPKTEGDEQRETEDKIIALKQEVIELSNEKK